MKHSNSSMKSAKIRFAAVLAAAALTLTGALALTACKSDSADAAKPTTAPTTATVAATTAKATTAPASSGAAQNDAQNSAQTTSQADGSTAQSQLSDDTYGHSIHEAWYAGISEQQAGIQALELCETGSLIRSDFPSYDGDGNEIWVVNIDDPAGNPHMIYVNSSYCEEQYLSYPSSGNSIHEAWYAGISEQQAGFTALEQAGGDMLIVSTASGYYTDGSECWIIRMSPDGTENDVTVAFVSGDYCYFM